MITTKTDVTKEPWQLGPFEPDFGWTRIETVERGIDVPSQGYTLAVVYGPTVNNSVARLMVAAPKLLQALEKALENGIDCDTCYCGSETCARTQARAAILEACGSVLV